MQEKLARCRATAMGGNHVGYDGREFINGAQLGLAKCGLLEATIEPPGAAEFQLEQASSGNPNFGLSADKKAATS